MTGTDSNCPNNEPNFFRKHVCDDTKVMVIFTLL
jgi:interleukin 7